MPNTNKKQAAPAAKEFANLDVLRATAVLLVLATHLAVFWGKEDVGFVHFEAFGLLGVLMFFVHTSFVLMHSLERQERQFGRRSLWSIFMIRRCFRIYPLAWVVVCGVYFSGIPSAFTLPGVVLRGNPTPYMLWNNLCLLRNIIHIGAVVGPLWTLPFEMQMYLFLPAFYLLARKISLRALLGLWIVAVFAAVAEKEVMALPMLLHYVACFMGGIIAFKIWPDTKRTLPSYFLGIVILLIMGGYTVSHGNGATFRGMAVCLFLGLMLPRIQEVANPTLRSVSHFIAKYSYGIYLTHIIAIWIAFVVLKSLPLAIQWPVFFLAAFGIPVALFHAVESPMIQYGHALVNRLYARKPSPRPELAVAADESAAK